MDTTCNGTSSCKICDNGYYLSSGKCLFCSNMPANCLSCSPSAPSTCFQCTTGYYLSSGSCVACMTGCTDCSSARFCNVAAAGYFLVQDDKKGNLGRVKACGGNCATC